MKCLIAIIASLSFYCCSNISLNKNVISHKYMSVKPEGGSVIARYKNGTPIGRAIILLPDGTVIIGSVKNGQAIGKCSFYSPDHTVAHVWVKNGIYDGPILTYNSDGSCFFGFTKKGQKLGTFLWMNAERIELIKFKNNQPYKTIFKFQFKQ
jgi:antitoxin component YwqK of YwqJK toxin-antitoxin module